MQLRRTAAAAAALSALLLIAAPGAARAAEVLEGAPRVADGDTLTVNGVRIRLYGVDAPEKAQPCYDSNGKEYACGERSLDALKQRIAAGGGTVKCSVREKDQYGRSVASCAMPGAPGKAAEDMGDWLVSNGYAVAYRKITPTYIPAEERAKRARIGIWAGTFEMPAKWRYEKRSAEAEDVPDTSRPRPSAQELRRSSSAPAAFAPLVPDAAPAPAPAPAPASAPVAAGGRTWAQVAGAGAGAAATQQQQQQQQQQRPAAAAQPARSSDCKILGNINSKGEKLYHTTKSPAYANIKIEPEKGERYFCTEAEAQAAGWKPAYR